MRLMKLDELSYESTIEARTPQTLEIKGLVFIPWVTKNPTQLLNALVEDMKPLFRIGLATTTGLHNIQLAILLFFLREIFFSTSSSRGDNFNFYFRRQNWIELNK